ncbi:hypothetical protein JW877_04715 [bacterium]|nr:hypothetical protein [bacterium]
MGDTEAVSFQGQPYMVMLIIGLPTTFMLFELNAIFQAAGDKLPLTIVLIVSSLPNALLDPVFIYGWSPIPPMGIMGAGFATSLLKGILITLWFLGDNKWIQKKI